MYPNPCCTLVKLTVNALVSLCWCSLLELLLRTLLGAGLTAEKIFWDVAVVG